MTWHYICNQLWKVGFQERVKLMDTYNIRKSTKLEKNSVYLFYLFSCVLSYIKRVPENKNNVHGKKL